jgi:hypothetical protein
MVRSLGVERVSLEVAYSDLSYGKPVNKAVESLTTSVKQSGSGTTDSQLHPPLSPKAVNGVSQRKALRVKRVRYQARLIQLEILAHKDVALGLFEGSWCDTNLRLVRAMRVRQGSVR